MKWEPVLRSPAENAVSLCTEEVRHLHLPSRGLNLCGEASYAGCDSKTWLAGAEPKSTGPGMTTLAEAARRADRRALRAAAGRRRTGGSDLFRLSESPS